MRRPCTSPNAPPPSGAPSCRPLSSPEPSPRLHWLPRSSARRTRRSSRSTTTPRGSSSISASACGRGPSVGCRRRWRHGPPGLLSGQALQRRVAVREPIGPRRRDACVRTGPPARPHAALRHAVLRRRRAARAAHEHRMARRHAHGPHARSRRHAAPARHRAHDALRHAAERAAHPPQRLEVRRLRRGRRARHRPGRRGLVRLRLGRWVRRVGALDPRPAAWRDLRAA